VLSNFFNKFNGKKIREVGEIKSSDFLNLVVNKLGTCFATPEFEIICQDEPAEDMYFLSKGDCVVNIKDQRGTDHFAFRLLTTGDYFGEISMVYRCNRTASVVSRNYNTMARISYLQYREVVNEYPDFLRLLTNQIQQYSDKKLIFLKDMVSELPFVKHSPSIYPTTIYSLMFKMKEVRFQED